MHILDMATLHRTWLAQRQTVVAENIANVNTPGFVARTVGEFAEALKVASTVELRATNARHISPTATSATQADSGPSDTTVATHSGNTVDLEKELITAGDLKSAFALNVHVTKSFQRMLQAAVRS